MDDFFSLAIPVAVIFLLFSNARLKRRVRALEAKAVDHGNVSVNESVQATVEPTSAEPRQKPTPKVVPLAEPSLAATSVSQGTPKSVVFNTVKFRQLLDWITHNWFYVVSAVSLALAGVFLVIYGIEQGLLPPVVRILASIIFGCSLVVVGEFIRRRYGDGDEGHTAYLPSVFSGAGIVTLFGSVLSARLLYDFINPDLALVGMALVGIVALVLGWFNGPLLAAVGVIGAMVSPFIIGGSSDDPSILLVYFAIVAIVGLAIDTMRRWAWVSVISLILGFATGFLLMLVSGEVVGTYFAIYCVTLAIAAIAIPVRKLTPNHSGTLLSVSIFARSKTDPWPEFPTRLAGGSIIAASFLIVFSVLVVMQTDLFWIAVTLLSGLVLALLVWARNAPALTDLMIAPATALLAVVAMAEPIWRPLATAAKLPEADKPLMVSIVVAIGLTLSVVAAWHSVRGGPYKVFVALGASVMAPSVAIAIEIFWQPADAISPYIWALHAMTIAAILSAMAKWFDMVDGPKVRDRVSFAVLTALASTTFGIVILFSSAALTSAIAVTVVAAAWFDRQFNLPLMGLYILIGITTIGYRLVADPGLDWALNAPLPEILLAYAGAVVAFIISYILVKSAKRPRSEVLLESAVFSSAGILLSLLLYRAIQSASGLEETATHWSIGIAATIWIILSITQFRRLEIAGPLFRARVALGAVFLIIGAGLVLVAVTVLNPLLNDHQNLVLGPSLLNSLIPAYLLPAAACGFGAWWLAAFPKTMRQGFAISALILAGFWLGLMVRHLWRGAAGMELPGIDQPELYSYTVVLLIIGAALFYQSLAKQKPLLRKAGLFIIGLAVVKVFTLDIQGLGGLIRVFSLLFLGLALAGLAWLNRWAIMQMKSIEPPEQPNNQG